MTATGDSRGRRGLTLIEVIVTTLLLVVVIGFVATVPAAGRRRAADAQAQATALVAVDALQVLWERDGQVTGDGDALADVNGRIAWLGSTNASTDPSAASVAVDASGDQVATVAVAATSGRCWFVRYTVEGTDRGLRYGRFDADLAPCTGQVALTVSTDPTTTTTVSFNATDDALADGGYADVVAADGPASHWRLSTAAAEVDVIAGRDLTAVGNVEDGTSGAIVDDFDGAVRYGPDPDGLHRVTGTNWGTVLTPGTGVTLEVWVNPEQESDGTVTVPALTVDGAVLAVAVGAGNPAPGFDPGTGWVAATDPLQPGRWTHLVAVHNPAGGIAQLWVDGVLVDEAAGVPAPALGSAPLTLAGSGFAGRLDEAAVYPLPLPPDRVTVHQQVGREGIQ